MTTKAYRGLGMEGPIARWYAGNTAKNPAEFEELAARIAQRLSPGDRVLEVAPGPGYLAVELAARGAFHVTGLDISRTFVELATAHARERGVTVDFRQGDAAAMPFAAGSFEFIVCRAAFKNFSRPVVALQEMRRVLAAGGTALIIDLRKDASPQAIRETVSQLNVNPMNSLLTRWIFKHMLLKRAYRRDDFRGFITSAGFDHFEIEEAGVGFEIWLHK